MEISVADQASLAMFKALLHIAQGDMDGAEATAAALAGIKDAETIRRDGEPLHGIETSDRKHGERMGQPPGVLYTLTITDEGDANDWRSDRVQTADQIAWLHGMVLEAAAHLASGGGGSGMN